MAIKDGITITSVSDPELNGVYALDLDAVKAAASFIVVHGVFPNDLDVLPWADIDGMLHSFKTKQQFLLFAQAVASTVETLNAGGIAAQSATLP